MAEMHVKPVFAVAVARDTDVARRGGSLALPAQTLCHGSCLASVSWSRSYHITQIVFCENQH